MYAGDKYLKILRVIALYNNIKKDEDFIRLLKDKENKYLLLLLLKKNKCMNEEKIMQIFNYKSKKSINYNVKKAEEKFLINKNSKALHQILTFY